MPGTSLGNRGIHLVKKKSANPEQQQKGLLTRKTFRTGQAVPQSGIYRVTHGDHRLPHEVTLLRTAEFPPCSKCGVEVKFKLLGGLPWIHSKSFSIASPKLRQKPPQWTTRKRPLVDVPFSRWPRKTNPAFAKML